MLNKTLTQIHKKLLLHAKTIAAAESCTGGLLSALLTKHPGASNYFILGVITYSNKSKKKILSIPDKIISEYGSVSRQVAVLMAENIRKKTNTDFGLSITGIAGPGGTTPTKPVGTVYAALATKKKTICRSFSFKGSRENIRKQSALGALRLLCAHLSL